MNAIALLTLLLQYSDKLTQIGTLLSKTRAENREPSDAEMDALFAGDDAAKASLDAAIAAAKASGG